MKYVPSREAKLVTRIAFSENLTASKFDRLNCLAKQLGKLRTEVWDRFGSVAGVGLEFRTLRNQWTEEQHVAGIPSHLWQETVRNILDDIKMSREAAKVKVRKAIFRRTKDQAERKRLYTLLKADRWLEDSYLRRMMRKYFKHGHTEVSNQIILEQLCYKTFLRNGKAWVSVSNLERGHRIAVPLNTNVLPTGTLRLILRDGKVEVHYAIEAPQKKPCGTAVIGIDKGYTEAFTDSDGDRHGKGLGACLSSESDYLKKKYQNRNKLRTIVAKKPHVLIHNLRRVKLAQRKTLHTAHVRDIVFKAAHSVINKAKTVVCEDLTAPIPDRKYGKNQRRRLSGWVKGQLAEALETVSQRRSATLTKVNAAYTSQMDSRFGVLLGARVGDTFNGFDQVVQDADTNAARNILARSIDKEISLFTSFKEVKAILLRRTAVIQKRLKPLNQDTSYSDANGLCVVNGERITNFSAG